MHVNLIGPGSKAPEVVNVLIEIPAMSDPIKYEVDKDSGALTVDRFLGTTMFYPWHYGFIPGTLSDDGDPYDVLVWCPYKLQPGCVISCRVIGVLEMEDEAGMDFKALAVPDSKLSSQWDHIQDIDDVPSQVKAQIKHFFEHYKDLEPGKWVAIKEFQNKAHALASIKASMQDK